MSLKITKKAPCKYDHLVKKWTNGDEDRICVNDKCELCTLPITDDDCLDCRFYVKENKDDK